MNLQIIRINLKILQKCKMQNNLNYWKLFQSICNISVSNKLKLSGQILKYNYNYY